MTTASESEVKSIGNAFNELKKQRITIQHADMYDDHTRRHDYITVTQLTLFIVWLAVITLYLVRVLLGRKRIEIGSNISNGINNNQDLAKEDNSVAVQISKEVLTQKEGDLVDKSKDESKIVSIDVAISTKASMESKPPPSHSTSNVRPPPSFDTFLQHVVVFGAVMLYFFLCDFYKVGMLKCKIIF